MSLKLSAIVVCALFVALCCAGTQSDDAAHRARRHVGGLGGRKDVDESKWSTLLEKIQNAELTTIDGRRPVSVVRINTAQSQIVAGTKYYINAEFSFSNNEVRSCDIELLETLQHGLKVELKCEGDERRSKRRSKRSLVGGATDVDAADLPALQKTVSESLVSLGQQGNSPTYTLHRIIGAKKQLVAGILYNVTAEFVEGSTHKLCTLRIWEKPWIGERTVDISCDNKTFKVVRDARPKEAVNTREPLMDEIQLDDDEAIDALFTKFKTQFGRNYADALEHNMRGRIFRRNLYLLQQLRRFETGTAEYGITDFADMTPEEFHLRTGLRHDSGYENRIKTPAEIPDIKLPTSFDWREKGAVTPVKDQGQCGSCWAFSVTGNIEGVRVAKGGQLEALSEQELVDCDTVDHGCNGGLPDDAYKAIERIGGLEAESAYPYHAKQEKCKYNPNLSRVTVKSAVDLPADEEAIAKYLVEHGPISIGLNANAMQFYKGGISHPWKTLCKPSDIDHGVLIVGFGSVDYPLFNKTLPYWIIKNSWGPKWGEQGYYRLYRGDNTCGVTGMASSAVLD